MFNKLFLSEIIVGEIIVKSPYEGRERAQAGLAPEGDPEHGVAGGLHLRLPARRARREEAGRISVRRGRGGLWRLRRRADPTLGPATAVLCSIFYYSIV